MDLDSKNIEERYSRQMLFLPIGREGQKRLNKSKVTIIGCGGLGSVITNNLARAGVGYLRIVDRDRVELSNLQRQILFDEEDVKKNLPKAVAAKKKLGYINSDIKIDSLVEEVTKDNIEDIISGVDIVLDATDNFETRFLINDTCIKNKIPWIYGAVAASYGVVFNILPKNSICLRCIFREIPSPEDILTCNTVGIINSIVNVIASIQTTEALKFLTGNFDFMVKGIININIWDLSLEIIDIKKDSSISCPVCGR